jgi:hypothetical protein
MNKNKKINRHSGYGGGCRAERGVRGYIYKNNINNNNRHTGHGCG